MSHIANELFLEVRHNAFEIGNSAIRNACISELQTFGYTKEAQHLIDKARIEREQFLVDMCVTEVDVLEDTHGEFVYSETDMCNSDPEDSCHDIKKVYLPDNLQGVCTV